MGEKNTFLDSYKKKIADQAENKAEESAMPEGTSSAAESQKTNMKYELESGFKKPIKPSTTVVQDSKKSRRIITAAVIGTGVLLCIAIVIFLLMNQSIEVVDLTGWTENNAQLWARENGIILQIEEEYSDEVAAGKKMSQSIPAGTKIKKGDFEKLTIT